MATTRIPSVEGGIQPTLLTTKGDLISATAASTVARLGVGSDAQILVADSTASTGLAYKSVGVVNGLTTTGDTIYSSSGTTQSRLGIGSTGQVLTVASGVPSWATPSSGGATFAGCSIYKSAVQSISSSTQTTLSFNLELFDTDGYHDNATNNSRITIPTGKAGYYLIVGKVSFQNNATGQRSMYIAKNGTLINNIDRSAVSNNESESVVGDQVLYCNVADYFEMKVYQSSGGALNVNETNGLTSLSLSYLGA